MCIDKVAENLRSPKDALRLPLPDSFKEKIAQVVFDPDNDFCYGLWTPSSAKDPNVTTFKYKRNKHSSDIIVDRNAIICLISTVH